MDKAKGDGKRFFIWLNPTRMHVIALLARKIIRLGNFTSVNGPA